MPLKRFEQFSIRNKLLALSLLPLLVVLPLLALLLLVWGNTAFERMLITKVRSDLAVANGFFERVLAGVGTETAAVAGSHGLHLARSMSEIHVLLQQAKRRGGLDFLNLRAADGTLLVTDWGVPSGVPQLDAESRLEQRLDRREAEAHPTASIEVLSPATFAALAPSLQARVAVPVVPAPGTQPGARAREDRAMVMLALAPIRAPEGRLIGYVQGGVLLNRNTSLIDHINGIVYPEGSLPFGSQGTASLFLGELRVSTNVRHFGNERAVGTRVSPSVRDTVLGSGGTWLDRAFVVDDWYISGYQPLVDGAGQRVGMLSIGYLARPFTRLKYGVLAGVSAIFVSVMIVAAFVSLRWARSIFRPLEQMARTMQQVEAGAIDVRVGAVDNNDEIGELAGHLDHLLDAIDVKVAERTQELEASHVSLKSAQQRLVRAEKLAAVGRLTAGIAHELNNPIAVLQGNLDLVRELLGADASRVGAELQLADEQIERMRLIVTQLLQFARPTEFAGYVANVDVSEALEESLMLVGHLHAASHVKVVREFASDRTAAINRQELNQVLVNVLANAIHAMPNGGTLTLSTRDWDDDGIEVSIADSGPGMSEELIADVFEPFVTRKSGGTGLGLWISRSIVERYGGDIRASNRSDGVRGAVFSVLLRGTLNLDGASP
ncbi:cache domain-containing protein [Variovorax guangxiensis]|uniref:sensor histidine kinase n=1 Tax=Variovorax guangxiensis TaxID=1775474 RepID=UPI00285F0303|nr:cache domain-containing protein [Variovorax guangxiensis]MDR6860575.1 signal transduction histidine kinase [Variovorax guangxiensis]